MFSKVDLVDDEPGEREFKIFASASLLEGVEGDRGIAPLCAFS